MTGRSSVAMPAVKQDSPDRGISLPKKDPGERLARSDRPCHADGMSDLFRIDCAQPWLVASFATPQRMLSWSLNRPGFTVASRVAWLEVRNADLPLGVDPHALLSDRLATRGLGDAVAMMTARDVRRHHRAHRAADGVEALALATAGLSNGIAFDEAGALSDAVCPVHVGTINLLVALSCPMADGALLEAISVAATARTAALLADGGKGAATGTDCIILACPQDGPAAFPYSGLHTPAGRSLAAATYAAIRDARAAWEAEFGAPGS